MTTNDQQTKESGQDNATEQQKEPENILKVSDDAEPVRFKSKADKKDYFEVVPKEGEAPQELKLVELRKRIEPWLTALFQSEHLSLLVGSGLMHAVHGLATGRGATGMGDTVGPVFEDEIERAAKRVAEDAGRGEGNFEDRIRVANDLWRGLKVLGDVPINGKKASDLANQVELQIEAALKGLADGVLASEKNIATALSEADAVAKAKAEAKAAGLDENVDNGKVPNRDRAIRTLVSFLMSFASRTGTRDRLQIFTTNYDRVIEEGAELAGLYLLDRFVGSLSPIFRSSRLQLDLHYNPPGIRGEPRYLEGVARLTKLHGSLDWVEAGHDIRRIGLPFGAESLEPYLNVPGYKGADYRQLMIYPNAAKDTETSDYPYAELFRDFAASICRPNSTLVTYGYSFGDDHINRVIRDMLTIPSTHLVVISHGDPLSRIENLIRERYSQVSLLIGPVLGDLEKLTTYFLPKAAIDWATSRMADILRRRYGAPDPNAAQQSPTGANQATQQTNQGTSTP